MSSVPPAPSSNTPGSATFSTTDQSNRPNSGHLGPIIGAHRDAQKKNVQDAARKVDSVLQGPQATSSNATSSSAPQVKGPGRPRSNHVAFRPFPPNATSLSNATTSVNRVLQGQQATSSNTASSSDQNSPFPRAAPSSPQLQKIKEQLEILALPPAEFKAKLTEYLSNTTNRFLSPEENNTKQPSLMLDGTKYEHKKTLQNNSTIGARVDLYESSDNQFIVLKTPADSIESLSNVTGKITPESQHKARLEMHNEILMHQTAAGDGSKYIIGLQGLIWKPNGIICTALEYSPGGSLADFFKEPHPTTGKGWVSAKKPTTFATLLPATPMRLALLHDMCLALIELHDQREMLHLDLKPQNFLITKDGDLKLCDFGTMRKGTSWWPKGLAELKVQNEHWLAPEIVKYWQGKINEKKHLPNYYSSLRISPSADIWSFSVTALELITGHDFFEDKGPLKNLPFNLLPFTGDKKENSKTLYQWNAVKFDVAVKKFQTALNEEYPEEENSEFSNLIMGLVKLLHPSPSARPKISEFWLNHGTLLANNKEAGRTELSALIRARNPEMDQASSS
jgi:serine/threonine protein kinase